MRVAVLTRAADPASLRVYRENSAAHLSALGCELEPFPEAGPIPVRCDLVWDPGLGMRRIPAILRDSRAPVVGTLHGVKIFSLPIRELASGWRERWQWHRLKRALRADWAWFGQKAAAVVAVSEYAAEEARLAFGLPRELLHVVHHGVDTAVFSAEGERAGHPHPYFFHVSAPSPVKNLDRLFAAWAQLPEAGRPDLVAVLPGFAGEALGRGIQIIREALSQTELARWYRGALAFVFPSLRETFGMPIIEAMACGCPVVTSNITGCPEAAGDAALLVDPRSTNAIAEAMGRLAEDRELCESLRARGLARAARDTWRASAERLLSVFRSACPRGDV